MSSISKASGEPHISVVIPVYNEEDQIGECLDALSIQTVQSHVVYIVDNNSTDKSIAIARTYPFVTVLTEQTQGICAATVKGFDTAAKNDGIILRLDADSRPHDDWIERMTESVYRDKSIVAVTGPGIAYDGNPIIKVLFTLLYMQPYFLLVGLALGRKPLFGSNLVVRASSWTTINHETHLSSHQNIHDDIDLSFHLLKTGRIKYEHTIKMPISSRPFRASLSSILKRYSAGFRSIFIHWPEQAPWNIWFK